jgi:hypothetical protein
MAVSGQKRGKEDDSASTPTFLWGLYNHRLDRMASHLSKTSLHGPNRLSPRLPPLPVLEFSQNLSFPCRRGGGGGEKPRLD